MARVNWSFAVDSWGFVIIGELQHRADGALHGWQCLSSVLLQPRDKNEKKQLL